MAKKRKIPSGWYSTDVEWYVPKKKKPIAYSTKAASALIVMLSEDYKTISEVQVAINFDKEAKKVLQKYIDAGFGDAIAKDFFG